MLLAQMLRRLPAEVDDMPYLDSLTLTTNLLEAESEERKFRAALAGINL